MTEKEKLEAIRAEIHRLVDVRGYDREMANDLFAFMDSLPNEPVSEDLEDAAYNFVMDNFGDPRESLFDFDQRCFITGAKWQKNHLWKPADGDDLPEFDREVVAFAQVWEDAGLHEISFAHRPNPEGYDGKSLTTGEIEHYSPKTYDKGGWNIPDVKWWLDYDINELLCK